MKPIKETNQQMWTAQIWQGNPSLNLVCSCKIFTNPFNGRKVPVWIFGGTKEYQGFSYCVNAGVNSSYSYTGSCRENYELHNAEIFVDNLYGTNQLFK